MIDSSGGEGAFEDLLEEINVVRGHDLVVELLVGLAHDPADLRDAFPARTLEKGEGRVDGPAESRGIVVIEEKAVALVLVGLELLNGVVNSSGVSCDGKSAVLRSNHLGQAARLEEGRHQVEICRCESLPGEALLEINANYLLVETVSPNDLLEMTLEGPIGHRRILKPEMLVVVDDLIEEIGEELAALLDGVEARGPEQEGGIWIDIESKAPLEAHLVRSLAIFDISRSVVESELGIGGGIVAPVWGIGDPARLLGRGLVLESAADGVRDTLVMTMQGFVRKLGFTTLT